MNVQQQLVEALKLAKALIIGATMERLEREGLVFEQEIVEHAFSQTEQGQKLNEALKSAEEE